MSRSPLRSHGRVFLRVCLLAGSVLTLLAFTLPVSAHAALVRTEPAANSVVAPGVTQLRLVFSSAPDPRRSTITVFNAQHQPVDAGVPTIATDDPLSLLVPLPRPPAGLYTVVWTTTAVADNDTTRGSYAFSVNATPGALPVVKQPQPQFTLSPLDRVIPRWLSFISIMAVVGSLALRFLVWRPALAQISAAEASDRTVVAVGDADTHADATATVATAATAATTVTTATDANRVDRRILLFAGGALVLFVFATLAQFIWEAGNAAKRPFPTFDGTMLSTFLGTAGAGNLWAVRLIATALLAVAILPVAAMALRSSRSLSPRVVTLAMLLGILFGASELLVRTLPARVTLSMARTVFTSLADWAHLLGGAIWVGGLTGLVVTASLLRAPAGAPNLRLRAVARQFSYVALVCVGVLILSGLWTAWIHVGSVSLLFTTLYGKTLFLKLMLFLVLVALGAFNLLWLLPRMDAARVTAAADSGGQSGVSAFLRPFRRAIAVEMLVGLTILLIVPFLSGSARNQAAQVKASNLTQTAMAGDLPVTFMPSALQPGNVRYDVSIPAGNLTGVSFAFASKALNVPETTIPATVGTDGHYQVTGLYAPMVGAWQARVLLHGPGTTERSAQFDLPVRATPVTAPPFTPQVQGSTWFWGILETALVALVLASALFVSRRMPGLVGKSRTQTVAGGSETPSVASGSGSPSVRATSQVRRSTPLLTAGLILGGVIVLGVVIWQAFAWDGSPADPTDPENSLSTGTVIVNSGILVFREGLEMILVLSAVTASFLGANANYRRPVAAGAGVGIAASVVTWFLVVAILDAINAPALHVQAATGLLAIVVLLVVMNWFFHRVYWAGWIGMHQKRRKELVAQGADGNRSRLLLGLALLGFTSVYREGFEIVLFLQNLRLRAGVGPVVAGLAVGLALTAIVGVLTFALHHKLPYKKMLVFTGIMLGAVLIVMVGESIQEMQLAGWIPATAVNLPIPDWMGLWFAIFPNVEGLLGQVLAAVLVIGSYFAANYVRVRAPQRRGESAAIRPETPPALSRDERQPV